ncbi:MAG: hypothetical protein C5B59_08095 [Bacteroidetes bacterium]|nr:MAG: hypothetical protein C5B59_08095 [Bacteroidota bacterium]
MTPLPEDIKIKKDEKEYELKELHFKHHTRNDIVDYLDGFAFGCQFLYSLLVDELKYVSARHFANEIDSALSGIDANDDRIQQLQSSLDQEREMHKACNEAYNKQIDQLDQANKEIEELNKFDEAKLLRIKELQSENQQLKQEIEWLRGNGYNSPNLESENQKLKDEINSNRDKEIVIRSEMADKLTQQAEQIRELKEKYDKLKLDCEEYF